MKRGRVLKDMGAVGVSLYVTRALYMLRGLVTARFLGPSDYGIWGTLALGLFYDNDVATNVAALATGLSRGAQTLVQLKGIVFVGAWVFGMSMVFWLLVKVTMGVRVTEEEELEGLDLGEHGNSAYPDFATHQGSFGHGTGLPATVARPLATGQPATVKP